MPYNNAPNLSAVNNPIGVRNIYPTAGGRSTGQVASAANSGGTRPTSSGQVRGANAGSDSAVTGTDLSAAGFMGQPSTWWIVFALLFLFLVWGSRKLGTVEEFRKLDASPYNIIFIALAAMLGKSLLKVAFNFWPVKGLTEFVNAA